MPRYAVKIGEIYARSDKPITPEDVQGRIDWIMRGCVYELIDDNMIDFVTLTPQRPLTPHTRPDDPASDQCPSGSSPSQS